MIGNKLEKITEPVDALFLVGGFSGNEYLFTSIQVWPVSYIPSSFHHISLHQDVFRKRIPSILRPLGADAAACCGTAQYGRASMNNVTLISSTISTKSYILGVEIPAEPEDMRAQPRLIATNYKNIKMCSDRYAVGLGTRPQSTLTAILCLSGLST